MLRIGVFAQMAHVSVKCLRYYDDIGLLHPVQVDSPSGYRYYTAEQLPRLHRILALKELGFSLEDIAMLLDAPVSNQQLREMLKTQQSQTERRIREEQERLDRLSNHLKSLEASADITIYDVIIKRIPPQQVARLSVTYQEGENLPLVHHFEEVRTFLREQNITQCGPEFSLWHGRHSARQTSSVDVNFPVKVPLRAGTKVHVSQCPGKLVATTVHKGLHRTTQRAVDAAQQWIDMNGYRLSGPRRHIYHLCDKTDRTDSVVEIQLPIEKKARVRR